MNSCVAAKERKGRLGADQMKRELPAVNNCTGIVEGASGNRVGSPPGRPSGGPLLAV